MIKKLIRNRKRVALVLDKALLEQLGLDESSEVDLSANGQVLSVTPKRDSPRERRFRKSAAKVSRKYAGLFRLLSE